tara:strand:+ start:455 stop:727 length:273 start_codon:yes stop_codon:yes gene_type:complete
MIFSLSFWGVFDYLLLEYNTDLNPCQVLFSSSGSGALNTGDVIFNASVDSIVIEKGNVLSPEETVCEIFDLAEAHFFLFLDCYIYIIADF